MAISPRDQLCCRAREIAVAFPEQRCTFGGFSRVPDVTFIRWERIPLDQHDELLGDFSGPPDVAVEILSPDQSFNDLIERCRWYVDNGVQLALAVHARHRFVLEFRTAHAERRLTSTDEVDFGPVIPGFALRLDRIFGSLRFRRK
jgi:Uma2 family endonuclease